MIGLWFHSIDLLHVSTESQIIVNFFLKYSIRYNNVSDIFMSFNFAIQTELSRIFNLFFFYVLHLYIKPPKIKIKRIKWKCILVEKEQRKYAFFYLLKRKYFSFLLFRSRCQRLWKLFCGQFVIVILYLWSFKSIRCAVRFYVIPQFTAVAVHFVLFSFFFFWRLINQKINYIYVSANNITMRYTIFRVIEPFESWLFHRKKKQQSLSK